MIGEELRGKRIFLTGASGFVGSSLARRLLRIGVDLRIFVRKQSNPPLVEQLKQLGANVFYGDLRNFEDVSSALPEGSIVFHIAALFRQAKYPDKVYFDVNVDGTRNLLDACVSKAAKRVVHCSTIGVHSHIPNPPAAEDEDYRPGDVYQDSKCEGEKLARSYFSSGRLEVVIVRPAMIWGEGDRRLLKLFRGISQRKMPIIGDGKTLTHWVYIRDLVNGFLLAATRDNAVGQTYIFAGKRAVPIETLFKEIARQANVNLWPVKIPAQPMQLAGTIVEKICQPFGVEPPIYRRRVDFFTKTRSFSIEKARRELAYEPGQEFEKEVSNIFSWYKEQGWL